VLKRFEVSGFKNFAHNFVLDFSDVRDYRFNEHCIKNGLLKSGIIYGRNSSGKSNFSLAIFDIVAHFTENNVSPGLYGNYLNITNGFNSPNVVNKARFQYTFQFDKDEVDYEYTKTSNNTLLFEKLVVNGNLAFDGEYGSMQGDRRIHPVYKETFSPELNFVFHKSGSALKFAFNNTAFEDNHPLYKMMIYVSRMLWFRSFGERENRYIGYKSDADDYYSFILEDDSALHEFQQLLDMAGIKDKISVETDADGKKKLYTTPANGTGLMPFFGTASSGTRALYNFFYWRKTAPETSLMVIDEFDAYYHFELSETIVDLLSKLPDAQIILTSHNTNLLTNRIMRPDCFFILTSEKLTSFANATSRELREGHNLEKLYAGSEFSE